MNVVLLYLLLLKATLTSFSGLASLPILRGDLVAHHKVLSDAQLALAVAAGQSGPGPIGLYVVSAGYMAGGVPGAVAGWLAVVTPAFVIVPLLHYLGSRAGHPAARRAVRAVVIGAAGLILTAAYPIASDTARDPVLPWIALAAFAAAASSRVGTAWVIAGAALAGLARALF